ncbi:hypothetical protein DYB26_015828 [Aphanomyces astaci]|uniref:Uncharacterized protein n=1 Tax=Aphanomyces astaci TaxID=112090 RepID=A0A3R7CX13_APHAT|nr:hypothetical protein DYB26_015828 [Aphanomyces astaci]
MLASAPVPMTQFSNNKNPSRGILRSTLQMNSMSSPATPRPTNAIVLSWNDFLCPVEWLQGNIPPTFTTHSCLLQLDQCIVQLLLHASTIGPVFVLCESGASFIEGLCTAYLPGCAQLFSSPQHQARIQLICATTTLTSAWHGQILQMICTQRLPVSTSYGLVTVGGAGLREGCLALAKYAPVVLPKVLRVVKTRDLTGGMPEILHRLVGVGRQLGGLLQHGSAVDLSI